MQRDHADTTQIEHFFRKPRKLHYSFLLAMTQNKVFENGLQSQLQISNQLYSLVHNYLFDIVRNFASINPHNLFEIK